MTPPGRALAGWWRQLAPHAPLRLWFADLTVHRLEVLARCACFVPMPQVQGLVLNALTVFSASQPEALARRLGLSVAALRALVGQLERAGFAQPNADGTYAPTAAGSAAVASGEFEQISLERRTFGFLDPRSPDAAPTFVPLTAVGWPIAVDAPPGLLPALRDCLTRPEAWKQAHDFPADVTAILDATTDAANVPSWQCVPVCRAERILLAIIQVDDNSILGFAVTPDQWTLAPAASLMAAADTFAELPEPNEGVWREAWREWCRPVRGATAEDVAAAILERSGHRLRVRVVPRLLEKLKVGRPEAFRGDGWLLAGAGAIRAAVEVELEERSAAGG